MMAVAESGVVYNGGITWLLLRTASDSEYAERVDP